LAPTARPSPVTLKGILLDKDGTLIDFDATWGPAAYEVMRTLAEGDPRKLAALVEVSHYVLDERRFLPTSPLLAGSSAGYGPLWAEALGREAGPALFTEMDELFRFWGLESLSPVGVPAEVAAALVQRGYRLGIATNDAELSARDQARALALEPFIDFVAGYDSGFGAKPEPGMVHGFADACGFATSEIALVGDTRHDLDAARAAGAIPVAVLTGPRGPAAWPDLAPYADFVIPSIAALPALLDGLRAGQEAATSA
jgi:phosphoglycolate phosphatase